jgi:hypothetical protein
MIKALKVALIVVGAIHILFGLSFIFIPEQWATLAGAGETTAYVRWLFALLGASFIAGGVYVIVAGRDPLQHINWVKYVILKNALVIIGGAYLIIRGYVDFSQIGAVIILDAVIAAVLLAFYPWRAASSIE